MRNKSFLAPFFGGHRKRRSLLASPRNNLARAGIWLLSRLSPGDS